jgi:hypothetical protein
VTGAFSGPLPRRDPIHRPPPGTWWRAVVERVTPDLAVSIPAYTGQGNVRGRVEIVPGLTVTVGARVWVVFIEGSADDVLIAALRA